ncbi:transcription initiation factor TFIID subunit 11 [Chytriomyces hyalinus]|nr:transcription initiation factor TFIID subunit 11 [Chytriomyces hyalinus]KAJ3264006.1 transcription initiation factor TFIID subunit 11 [Chytriomyces hyalinus]
MKPPFNANDPIPIDPETGRPIRGKGSRGSRASRPKELGGARLPRSFAMASNSASSGPSERGSVRGRGSGLGRGRGRGRGRAPQTARDDEDKVAAILPVSTLLDIPEVVDVVAAPVEDPDRMADAQEQMDEDLDLDDSDDDEDQSDEDKEIIIQPQTDKEKQEMRALIESLGEEDLHRFEVFRRSKLSKNVVKKILTTILGTTTVPANVLTAVGGTGKLFVGDIVEIGREVILDWGEDEGTALSPAHVREAYRRWKMQNKWLN